MDDLISREEALEAINRIWDKCEEIEAHLPEGDPDKTGYKMIADYLTVWKYLSAQPEIKADENNHYKTGYDQGFVDACKMYEKKQPEIKTGQWIPDEIAAYDLLNGKPRGWVPWLCSECGYCVGKHQTRFCPDCGALMCGKAK